MPRDDYILKNNQEKVGDPQRNQRKNMKTLRTFENKYPHNKKNSLEYITG